MKTIAQQINWDFETNGNLRIKDKNGNKIYWENLNGRWKKREYDSQGNEIYYEGSDGYWSKWEYDSKGNQIYYESSNGAIKDDRPCEVEETIIDSVKYKLTKV